MSRDLPRKKRRPRRKAPWMKDLLPERATDSTLAAAPKAPEGPGPPSGPHQHRQNHEGRPS